MSRTIPTRKRLARVAWLTVGILSFAGVALAQPTDAPPAPASATSATPAAAAPSTTSKGVAVLSTGAAREDAFMLARAVYGSRLRPPAVDEAHARVLAGESPAADAAADLRELAELRAAITGDDAPSRRLLGSLADQLHVAGLLVVSAEGAPAPSAPAADAGAPDTTRAEAGASANAAAPALASQAVVARLFLADAREFDAARYAPEPGVRGPAGWRSVVSSVERRFPAAASAPAAGGGTVAAPLAATRPSPPTMKPHEGETKLFYASPWFWGAVGAAVLVGGAVYLATQDTSSEPIHLKMRVP